MAWPAAVDPAAVDPAAVDPAAVDPGVVGAGADASDRAECRVWWFGPAGVASGRPGSEAVVQALCGLMQLHGRDRGEPRPLGLEVASVAAGVLAAQGLTAAVLGRLRGRPPVATETSVLQAGLLSVSHYLAAATCPEEWVPAPPATGPGPPFATADGQWFEMETLDPEAWKGFWLRLDAPLADLGRAWTLFRSRYYRGVCTLPPSLHQASARHRLDDVADAAEAEGVSLSRLRDYREVLAEPGTAAGDAVVDALGDRPLGGQGPAGGHSGPPDYPPVAAEAPLAGLHVVEATNRLQGPMAGLLLQMLGAHVTKVEPPGGDIGRTVPPMAGETGSFFLCFNRGKGSVELDLASPAGRRQLLSLAAGADVFLHNWRPGKVAEWGLEAHDLAVANPGLVYVQASGWGPRSPVSKLVGTDFLVQAYSGMGHGLHPDADPPFPSRLVLVDFMGALVTSEGALSGLFRRHTTGRGCRVDTSLLSGAMALQAHVLSALAAGTESGRRHGRPLWEPLDRPLETADGWLVLTVSDDEGFARLCRACGVDPRRGRRPDAEAAIAQCLPGAPAAVWEERLSEVGIPCVAVPAGSDAAAVARDPRLAELLEPLAGTSVAPASPWRFQP
jgi:crotonobetainyl-CoA:carnitine CoA-transferase CaiB-like acyl-CoA transferase